MIDFLTELDQRWTLALNGLGGTSTDQFWIWVTTVRHWAPLLLLLAALLFRRLGWKRALVLILLTGIAVGGLDPVVNIIKHSFARLRPCNDPAMIERGLRSVVGPSSHPYGFFSGHAFGTMLAALSVAYGFLRGTQASRSQTAAGASCSQAETGASRSQAATETAGRSSAQADCRTTSGAGQTLPAAEPTCAYAACRTSGGRRQWTFLAVVAVGWALLVSVSRVMLGRHYIGDILVGMLAAVIVASAILIIYERISYWIERSNRKLD